MLRQGSGTFSVDHRGKVQAQARFSDRAWVDGKLTAWRVSDPTSLPRLGVAATLSPVLYGRAEAGVQGLIADRWSARVGYAFEGARIYDERSQAGAVHEPTLGVWFRASRITDLGVEGRFQQFVFAEETATAASATASVRHRFTRQVHALLRAGAGSYMGRGMESARAYPRLHLELGREGERTNLALVLGHDLVGASGFTAALWADYASGVAEWRPFESLKLFGAASVYRNGRAPDLDYWPLSAAGDAQGYGLAAGVEWQLSEAIALKLQGDRFAQIGAAAPGATSLGLNVISARVVVTPFDWARGKGW
jgi:opacity protein-like surface antigen